MTGSQSIIQVDYDPLTQIALHCDDCGQHIQTGYTNLIDQIDRMRSGGWESEAAILFYASMDQEILPAIERLKASLYASHDVLQELMRLFQSADEEAAECLNLGENTDNDGFSGNGTMFIEGFPKGENAFYKIDPNGGGGVYQEGGDRDDIYEAIGPMTEEEQALVDAILDYHETGQYEGGFMVEIENPEDVVDLFDTIRNLDLYGADLDGDKPWTIEELTMVESTITSLSNKLYGLATSMGYNIGDPHTLFRELYGRDGHGRFTITRGARTDGLVYVGNFPTGKFDENGVEIREDKWAYGVNRSNGIIELGNRAFYNPANGEMWSETNPGGLLSSNLDFTLEVLIGHETNHSINWKLDGTIEFDGNNVILDEHYHDNMRNTTHTFDHTYQFTYTNDDGVLVSGTVSRENNLTLYDESGFTHFARSGVINYETLTDALNAYTLNLYTIGPEFSYDENVAGLARREQGRALWEAIIVDRLGEPSPHNPLP